MKLYDVISVNIEGESHSPSVSLALGGLPAGETINLAEVQNFADRRKSGKYLFSTPRREDDKIVWDEGVCEKGEDNAEISGTVRAHIDNTNVRPADYRYVYTPRPSHADFVSAVKDGADAAASGGGRFSGRMTAPLVIAGGIAKQLLAEKGIKVLAYISDICGVHAASYKKQIPTAEEIEACHDKALPMLSDIENAKTALAEVAAKGDSAGGTVECVVYGLPVGLGDSGTDGLESKISAAVFGIPAVKGVEFGAGFDLAEMTGSHANDPFAFRDGKVVTLTNNAGGINGGISNGMPVTLRAVFRPTPSISLPQRTVDLQMGKETEIEIKGRHDVTVVPRAVAVVESAVALAVLDEALKCGMFNSEKQKQEY